MAFRSDIYLTGQPVDILGSVEKGLRMSDLIQQRRAQREEQEQNNLISEALARNSQIDQSGNVSVNQGALLSQLTGKVPAQKLMQVQQQVLGQQKMQSENKMAQFKQMQETLNMGAQYLQASLANPQVWPQAREKLMQLSGQEVPEQYDPNYLKTELDMALSHSQKLDQQMKEANLAQTKAQTAKTRAETSQIGKEKVTDIAKVATELRKERSALPTTKDTNIVATSYNTMKSIANDATGASDMSLIFSYMKMLDPASTVREGEYASAKNTAGIPERILNSYNKAIDGQFLSPQQRQDFVNQAKKKFDVQMAAQKKVDQQFESLAKKAGADPKDVIFDIEEQSSVKPNVIYQGGFEYKLNPQTGEYE